MFHCRMNSTEVVIHKGKDLSGHSNRQHFFAHFHPMIILFRYSKVTRSNFSHGAQQIVAHLVFPETIGLMCICACVSSVSFFVWRACSLSRARVCLANVRLVQFIRALICPLMGSQPCMNPAYAQISSNPTLVIMVRHNESISSDFLFIAH